MYFYPLWVLTLIAAPTRTAHIPVVAAHAGHEALSISRDNQDIFATRCAEDISFFNATLGATVTTPSTALRPCATRS